jgi:hypothetical protein
MAGRNYGTMFMGYHYDESKTNIGYDIWVEGGVAIHNVAYHSKGQLIEQLVHSGYKKEDIKTRRVNCS